MARVLLIYIALAIGSLESAPADSSPRPDLITFSNGTISINFLGFKASAGLGGLITGNMADGGPHAEAETPFGQRAGAGLGAKMDPDGQPRGFAYGYATNAFKKLWPVIYISDGYQNITAG